MSIINTLKLVKLAQISDIMDKINRGAIGSL